MANNDHWKDQPREPEGSKEGGQWVKAEGAAKEAAGVSSSKAKIPGLEEYQKGMNAWNDYIEEVYRQREDGWDGTAHYLGGKPSMSSDELALKYPDAHAYMQMKYWSLSSDPSRKAAGEKALSRIAKGENVQTVYEHLLKRK